MIPARLILELARVAERRYFAGLPAREAIAGAQQLLGYMDLPQCRGCGCMGGIPAADCPGCDSCHGASWPNLDAEECGSCGFHRNAGCEGTEGCSVDRQAREQFLAGSSAKEKR